MLCSVIDEVDIGCSGCCTFHRAVAFYTRDPRFKSSLLHFTDEKCREMTNRKKITLVEVNKDNFYGLIIF